MLVITIFHLQELFSFLYFDMFGSPGSMFFGGGFFIIFLFVSNHCYKDSVLQIFIERYSIFIKAFDLLLKTLQI